MSALSRKSWIVERNDARREGDTRYPHVTYPAFGIAMSKIVVTVAALAALFVSPVSALEIENTDGKDFYVYIGGLGESFDMTSVEAGKKIGGLCSDLCTLSIEGNSEEVAVVEGEKYQIKGGKLIRAN